MVTKKKVTITKKHIDFLNKKENRDNLREIARQLQSVINKHGFANLTRLKKYGLIKLHVVKKGHLKNGVIVGEKSYFVLTNKGKTILKGIRSFYG